ncbi:N-acetylmuramoyl-L-alanine amidase [Nocardia cyriacigeorgica]|uniref:N-acetylmuramoyl-L-alanine amidase n=1 Tax=Nocardia cyriacigeorgica TaxID=135487 RepID=UPI002456558A|nr:N-acetylmuramoyl-L-alanine amidase [Nocardia cyriacigeorgica]
MKPNFVQAGLCAVVSTALTFTLSGVTASAEPISPDMATKLAGRTVFLDPGHQGPNHTENLSRQVSDGRGGTKDCQTTGMTTVNGVAEHTINWNVAQLVKTSLESLGARVVLSRQDDSGWGGCIDERAAAANASGAAVAVSIHADGAPAQYRGFHVIVPQLPIPDAKADQVQSTAGLAASKAMRDAYLSSGFPAANYAGVVDGLQTRADVAGPALTTVPDVFIEMGNGANPEDAALLESGDGQLKHAIAITTGLVSFLLGAPPSADTPVAPPGTPAPNPPAAPPPHAPAPPPPPPAGDRAEDAQRRHRHRLALIERRRDGGNGGDRQIRVPGAGQHGENAAERPADDVDARTVVLLADPPDRGRDDVVGPLLQPEVAVGVGHLAVIDDVGLPAGFQ